MWMRPLFVAAASTGRRGCTALREGMAVMKGLLSCTLQSGGKHTDHHDARQVLGAQHSKR